MACAESRDIVALYALHEGVYVPYILGGPDLVNREFRELFADGLPVMAPLVAGSSGPPSADSFGDDLDGAGPPWPECLYGTVVEGFSPVVYGGGQHRRAGGLRAGPRRHGRVCPRGRGVGLLHPRRPGVREPLLP